MYAAAAVCERKYKNWSPANRRGKFSYETVEFGFLIRESCTQIGSTHNSKKAMKKNKVPPHQILTRRLGRRIWDSRRTLQPVFIHQTYIVLLNCG